MSFSKSPKGKGAALSSSSPSPSASFVQCPLCNKTFPSYSINNHLDVCLANPPLSVTHTESPGTLTSSPSDKSAIKSRQKLFSSPKLQHQSHNAIKSQPTDENTKKRKVSGLKAEDVKPLAERMRPTEIDQIIGQEQTLGTNKILRKLLEMNHVPNMILWGPPGCGKTTLALTVGKAKNTRLVSISATSTSTTALRNVFTEALGSLKLVGKRTLLFIDEIHRFNKAQQDILLPPVEDGTVTLIGATTENPSFEVNSALLSRCKVFVLNKLDTEAVVSILQRAVEDTKHGILSILPSCGPQKENVGLPLVPRTVLNRIAEESGGDARQALNVLELAIRSKVYEGSGGIELTEKDITSGLSRSHALYDRNRDMHYDAISALHKSIRGSDASAALYWLGRMVEGGEEPLYIARRLIRVASEDIGLADPNGLTQAVAAYQACHFVGLPECDLALAQCVTYLARAPKCVEVYRAWKKVKHTIAFAEGAAPEIPLHLRNAPTKLMEDLGYKKGYMYNPDFTPEQLKDQTYLPTQLIGTDFFNGPMP